MPKARAVAAHGRDSSGAARSPACRGAARAARSVLAPALVPEGPSCVRRSSCSSRSPPCSCASPARRSRPSTFRSGSSGSTTGSTSSCIATRACPSSPSTSGITSARPTRSPGRTGFAHLFEHLMFEGSKNVREGEFDTLLEAAGGNNNGSTNDDRTNYVIDVPANALELALFLESDRMALSARHDDARARRRPARRREERAPAELREQAVRHGVARARRDAVARRVTRTTGRRSATWRISRRRATTTSSTFFKTYYAPNNASLVVAGDIDFDGRADARREMVRRDPARRRASCPSRRRLRRLTGVTRKTLTDRVQLPRLYLAWLTPRHFAPGDAALDVVSSVLAGGKNSRLYKRLVYDTADRAGRLGISRRRPRSAAQFLIIATARPGHTAAELRRASSTRSSRGCSASRPPRAKSSAR